MAQVEKDGSSKMMDLSNRGGRAFFGLGSLLTGFKVNHCKDKTFTIGYVCFIVHLGDCFNVIFHRVLSNRSVYHFQ